MANAQIQSSAIAQARAEAQAMRALAARIAALCSQLEASQ